MTGLWVQSLPDIRPKAPGQNKLRETGYGLTDGPS